MKKGMLYGVGVGPGDPELMTLKAVRILRECDTVAAPDGERTAYRIAEAHLAGKNVIFCDLPMTRDRQQLRAAREAAADQLCALLDAGQTVAFLTLGDPSVYSTYWYLHKIVTARGYAAQFVPGVPSFCAAAAALNTALCEEREELHIIPAVHGGAADGLQYPGSKVLMKAGRQVLPLRDALREAGTLEHAALVERCGMEGERIVRDLGAIDADSGYFSIVLVKEERI